MSKSVRDSKIRFGVFELDMRSGELRRAGTRISLQDQPLKVLNALVEHPGEVVTREELKRRIWPNDSFGDFDHAVNVAVAKLRAALGDSADVPRYVETLPRRGYRFMFPVALPTALDSGARSGEAETEVKPAKRSFWFLWAAAAATIVIVGLIVGSWLFFSRKTYAPMQLSAELPVGAGIDRFFGAQLALSPDGTHIVVSEDEPDRNWRLAMRSVDQSQFVPLSGADHASRPFFSPDGQWLAFFADHKLKKLPVQGGVPVTLVDAPGYSGGASWGDDGNIIAAFSGGTSGLVRVPSGGGAPVQVTQLSNDNGETAHAWPQVLPGSQAVLFTAYGSGAYDDGEIVVFTFKTGERKTLHRGASFGRYLPSGQLVYLHQNSLWAAPFDLRRLEVTGAPQPVLEEVNSNVSGGGDFAFSQTGTIVYVSSKAQISFPYSIWWLERTGQT
jgi:eukaryotic-like serine/threonine-protein kinase